MQIACKLRPVPADIGMATFGQAGRAQKRIYGVETEYGIIFTPEGRKTLPVEKAIRFLFEKLITTEHFLNVFLENGARFYQDTGCHPEYATPECASPRQLIVYDKAGERILEDLQDYAEEKIREERIGGSSRSSRTTPTSSATATAATRTTWSTATSTSTTSPSS